MNETLRYAVGLDVGTNNVRAVVVSIDEKDSVSVIGYGEAKNAGMRKGTVSNLSGPSEAIDRMLGEVERMSGYEVNSAFVSVNGSHILSTKTEGMIAVGAVEHEIDNEDLDRLEDVAVSGRIPANRDVLDVIPLQYAIDGQCGIKNPIGMTGSRLEIQANVISALFPHCDNLRKSTENANVHADKLVPGVVAAGYAVLSEHQKENGVAVVDLGAATTSVAIFEEGDLQYVGVVPAGSNNITNDLAIMLGIDTEVAEELKRKYVKGTLSTKDSPISLKIDGETVEFERQKIDDVVQARLTEIFDRVQKEIKQARYEKRLPEGVVLVGGGAKMREIDKFVKLFMGCSVKIGAASGLGGVSDAVAKPEYATAVGLVLMAAEDNMLAKTVKKGKKSKKKPQKSVDKKSEKSSKSIIKKIFSKF